ncbi:MAG: ABC transporter ATP-binding protein [Pirellulaceae bacterium]
MSIEGDGSQRDAVQLKMQSVGVRFDGHPPVLEAVDFSVRRGEFVSMVGPSGCGKTTVLRLIAHLVEPTTGRVEVCGSPRTAYVFQEPNLLPWRNVVDNIRLPLELERMPGSAQQPAIEASLRMIGLQAVDYRKYPRMLSGGMKMRVSLARALVTQPDILLLDEPFAALDDMLRQQLNEDLLAIWQVQRWTALFVTHNVAEAVFLSQRVLIMSTHPGTIVESVPVPFVYPRSPAVRGQAEFAKLTDQISRQLRGG